MSVVGASINIISPVCGALYISYMTCLSICSGTIQKQYVTESLEFSDSIGSISPNRKFCRCLLLPWGDVRNRSEPGASTTCILGEDQSQGRHTGRGPIRYLKLHDWRASGVLIGAGGVTVRPLIYPGVQIGAGKGTRVSRSSSACTPHERNAYCA